LAGTPDDATGLITVNPGILASIDISSSLGGNAEAGVPFSVTVTAYDGDGEVKTDFVGSQAVDWTITGATTAPDGTSPVVPVDGAMVLASGVATYNGMMLVDAADVVTIDAVVGGAGDGVPPVVNVDPAGADHYTVVTSGAGTEAAGTAFSLTITAQDNYDNVVGDGVNDYDGAHDINFYSSATDAPDGTSPVVPVQLAGLTFANGLVVTGVSFTLYDAGETPSITAEDDVDTSVTGTTAGITVNGAGLSIVRINTGLAGNTAEVGTVTMSTDAVDEIDVHGSQYDAYMNYIGDSPAGTAWDVTGSFGPAPNDLSALTGTSVTFQPDNVGTGTVTVDDPGLAGTPDDATGLITVNPGILASIDISSSLGGNAEAG
jgi:hypothetical protein